MVHRYIVTVEELADAIRGIRRAMLNGNRSDEYNLATEDFAAALSDVFGIGVIDGKGDLYQIGDYSSDICPGAVYREQLGNHAAMRDAGSGGRWPPTI